MTDGIHSLPRPDAVARILVLHDHSDVSIPWLKEQFARRRTISALFLTGDDIFCADSLVHELGTAQVTVRLAIQNTCQVAETDFDLVVNRLTFPSDVLRAVVDADDLLYALGEAAALCVSLLKAFRCFVINGPRSGCLHGTWRGEADWDCLAHVVGLRTDSGWLTHRKVTGQNDIFRALIVFDGKVYGPPHPAILDERLIAFLNESDCDLVGVVFRVTSAGSWTYYKTLIQPDLVQAGESLIDALYERAIRDIQ